MHTLTKARTWVLGVPVVLAAVLGDATAIAGGTGRGGVTIERQMLFGSGDETTTEHWFGDETQDVSVTIHNGEISVRVNGEEIPVERLREEEGSIVILGVDGQPLERIGVTGSIELGRTFRVGGEAETPTVMLGVHLDDPGPALERHLRLEPETCTMITALYEGLPAHAAGLREYDIITKIEGKSPVRPQDIHRALEGRKPGDVVRLTVIHEGTTKLAEITLKAYDATAMEAAPLRGTAVELDVMLGPSGSGFGWTPQVERLLVAPDRQFFERLDMNQQRFDQYGRPRAGGPGQRDETMERLDRLDRRLDQLDAMLERLLERAGGAN